MVNSEKGKQIYILRAANNFYQNIFCNNIENASGKYACMADKIDCPKCGDWREPDVWYPSIDCGALLRLGEDIAKHFHSCDDFGLKALKPEEFKVFAGKLAHELGPRRPVVPGMVCGVWAGWATGKIGDFAWRSESDPLVRESVFQAMLDAGLAVAGAETSIRARHDLGEELIQLEIPPTARFSAACGVSKCYICDKFSLPKRSIIGAALGKSKPPIIDAGSFDDSIPFQRILEQPSTIIVTAALGELIKMKKFSDVALRSVELR